MGDKTVLAQVIDQMRLGWPAFFVMVLIAFSIWAYPPLFISSQKEILQTVISTHPEIDFLRLAVQFGRLDFVSALLTVLGIMLGMAAMVGFSVFRNEAKSSSVKVAEQVATDIATRMTNNRLNALLTDSPLARVRAPTHPFIDTGREEESDTQEIGNQGGEQS